MVKYAALLQFKGTRYAGFQKQKNGLAVQNVLEDVLSRINGCQTSVLSSGRTDAGVHVWRMPIAFWGREDIAEERFQFIINHSLPADIRILSMAKTYAEFHPQKNALEKQYVYAISNQKPSPMWADFLSYLSPIKEEFRPSVIWALRHLVGTHDFANFSKKGSGVRSTVRTIYEAQVFFLDDRIYFSFSGDGFLYGMVRLMVGTLMQIGWGKRDPTAVEGILSGKEHANYSVPAQGLHLMRVLLEPDPFK